LTKKKPDKPRLREVKSSSKKRTLYFLEIPHVKFVNGWEAFNKMKAPVRKKFQQNFDHWLQGHTDRKNRKHHGWRKEARDDFGLTIKPYVFKFVHTGDRIYGFLKNSADIRICVLVHHMLKKGYETRQEDLEAVEEISSRQDVESLVSKLFAQKSQGKKKR
jgi:hypothetical protein